MSQDSPHPTVALEKLTKQQLGEMKSFQNPPVNVKMVMSSVLAALGQQETWQIGQRIMSDPNFLKNLREYDCDNVHPKILKRLENFVKLESYDPQILQRQSLAASELANWVILLVLWQKSPNREARPQILTAEKKMKTAAPQQQKVPIKAQDKQAQIQPATQKQKVPIQKMNVKYPAQDNQFQDLETVPVHLRPLIRRIIEQQVQERLQEEVANLQEEMRQQMGHQKMRNEEMINQQFQQQDSSGFMPQYQQPEQYYPDQYYYGGPGGFYNPNFRHSFDYSQGFRYPSPVGRQRRVPEMYSGANIYKKKPLMQI